MLTKKVLESFFFFQLLQSGFLLEGCERVNASHKHHNNDDKKGEKFCLEIQKVSPGLACF
jgi:hypothetical protein